MSAPVRPALTASERPEPSGSPSPRRAAIVILDTNVVLDWLLWADPATDELDRGLRSGRWTWLWNARMQEELRNVLSHRLPAFDPERLAAVARAAQAWAQPAEVAADGPAHRLVCRDPSDQIFIDLAVSTGAARLLTRDSEVLRLARRARAHDLLICRPHDWPAER